MELIDLHTHTFFSDGVLSPAELVYRYKLKGCVAVAITDHVDYSNMEYVIKAISHAAPDLSRNYNIDVLTGVELTYIPPDDIPNMVRLARKMGAQLVNVHGETLSENVPPGTNLQSVKASCDILAHPGELTDEVARIAKENGVFIELTARTRHRDANKEVAEVAMRNGCSLVLNTDSHFPEDIIDMEKIESVLKQCNLKLDFYDVLRENALKLVGRK